MITEKLVKLLIEFEGFRRFAYLDQSYIWTIGYGTTRIYGMPVTEGMEINEPVGRIFLSHDCTYYMEIVKKLVYPILTENQLVAVSSLVYNIGENNFKTSTLLTELNAGREIHKGYFTRFNKIRIGGVLEVSKGLTYRRTREFEVFSKSE